MFSVMVLAYNLILHFAILPVNFAIDLKEGSMEVIQFINDWAGTGLDDISLGLHNLVDMFIAITNLINPFWWYSKSNNRHNWDNMYE